jgi:hypothetical protein
VGSVRTALVALALLASTPAWAAQRGNPFACLGEAESLARGNGTAEIEAEIDKRVAHPPVAEEGAFEVARHHCVTAELMRRVGDRRAGDYYRLAIAAAPDEPGFELWYGYYLRNVRGPRAPLLESAELPYFEALDKLKQVQADGQGQPFDEITGSWVRRGLMSLYQEDGLPLLRTKAYPYASNGAGGLGVALTTMVRISHDTNEVGIIDDARRFASEAAFASGPQRLKRPLDDEELRGIIRTPMRYDLYNRLRFRLRFFGAVDFSHELFRAPSSQISAFTEPNVFNDVKVDVLAVAWRRAFDLYPLFDLMMDLGYRRVSRVGVVEWYSQLREGINLYEAHPALSRFLGPDKLTVGMNYVYMQIPTIPGGKLEDRVRARSIRAFYFDYAIYRQLLLPDWDTRELRRTPTRGLHLYGGYAMDDEAFGVRVVYRQDAYGGISLRGLGRFDLTLQGTVLSSDTVEDSRDPSNAILHGLDTSQSVRQLRPTFIGLYRLVDDEAIPDVPKNPLAGLNLVVPLRADFAVTNGGTNAFDNVRGGAELWGKLISTSLRGTHFLLTLGYEAQWFYRLGKLVHIGRVELRMGWGTL